ncbi:MAG: hypothetical protein WAX89_03240 [Alphaproteobacteria bacterium]
MTDCTCTTLWERELRMAYTFWSNNQIGTAKACINHALAELRQNPAEYEDIILRLNGVLDQLDDVLSGHDIARAAKQLGDICRELNILADEDA